MSVSNKGGMFKGDSHDDGGIPIVVEETGQHIEVEGEEPLIPAEAMEGSNKKTYKGTNKQIIDKINTAVGAKATNEKATEVHAGDAVICKRSTKDPKVREYTGTPKQVISAVNKSGGCNEIESGAVEMRDGKKIQYKEGGATKEFSDLYKEHYDTWAKAENIAHNVCDHTCDRYAKEITNLWEAKLKAHFAEEENEVFPKIRNAETQDEIDALSLEHIEMESLIAKIRQEHKSEDIIAFCDNLKKHIKREEVLMAKFVPDPFKDGGKSKDKNVFDSEEHKTGEGAIKQYVSMMLNMHKTHPKPEGFYYKNVYDFLTQEAKYFNSQPLTKEERDYVIKQIQHLYFVPQMKNCFYNAQLLATNDHSNKIKYAEGLAQWDFFPMWHGFNTINGKIVDITWQSKATGLGETRLVIEDIIFGEFDKRRGYYGVEFNTSKIRRKLLKTGIACSNIDDWENQYPLLREKFAGDYAEGGIPSIFEAGGDFMKDGGKLSEANSKIWYHGTCADFKRFSLEKLGSAHPDFLSSLGLHFTKDISVAIEEFANKDLAQVTESAIHEKECFDAVNGVESDEYYECLNDYQTNLDCRAYVTEISTKKTLKITESELFKDILRFAFDTGLLKIKKEEFDKLIALQYFPKTTVESSIYFETKDLQAAELLDIGETIKRYKTEKLKEYDSILYLNEVERPDKQRWDLIVWDTKKIKVIDVIKDSDFDAIDLAEFKEGGKIEFDQQKLPKLKAFMFAERVRAYYPKVWFKGGNTFGNRAFYFLRKVLKRGYWLDEERWLYIKWQSYIRRHHKDSKIAGVVAMLKWMGEVDEGWAYMKEIIDKEVNKEYGYRKNLITSKD